jgi:desulfoferrodoxin (superoxide reductase-like protein)
MPHQHGEGDHLHIAMLTQLEDKSGEPSVLFKLGKQDDEADVVVEVGHVAFTPKDAHHFAMSLMTAALDVEFFSATVLALRGQKIPEEKINDVLKQIDVYRQARRDRE